jgi:hypothetical protein
MRLLGRDQKCSAKARDDAHRPRLIIRAIQADGVERASAWAIWPALRFVGPAKIAPPRSHHSRH